MTDEESTQEALQRSLIESWDAGARVGVKIAVRAIVSVLDAQETLGLHTIPTQTVRTAVEALPKMLAEILKAQLAEAHGLEASC